MRLRLLLALAAVTTLALFSLPPERPPANLSLPLSLRQLADNNTIATQLLETLEREVVTPPPLRRAAPQPSGQLTVSGIIADTNKHRAAAGAKALTANATLNAAAVHKLNDMFAQQYFGHVSPSKQGPADVVEGVGYAFLRVGENLALGNFASNAELVAAWMDSEGHRANILDKNFTELGAAAAAGTLEGKNTWLAVQTFALPASACPTPSRQLRDEFAQKKETIEQTSAALTALKEEFESPADAGQQKIAEGNKEIERGNEVAETTHDNEQAQPYWDRGKQLQEEGRSLIEQARAKQTAYNKMVDEYNSQNAAIASLVTRLNRQIAGYNSCLKRWQ